MTGWPPGLLQDDCRKLSKWLAGKPDARYIARKNIDMIEKNDPHAELMRMIQALEISAARDGRDEHPTDRTQQAYECVNAFARTLTDRIAELEAELARPETTAVSLMRAELHNSIDRTERAERMFGAACAALGAINEALGLDPDDGGAEPIIDAIQEMQSCVGAGGVETMMPKPCEHQFYHFGTEQMRRRCNLCCALELDQPASQWISVDERLPLESEGTVAVLMDDGSLMTAWPTYWHGVAQWSHPFDVDGAQVTHWMPLSATPKEPS